MQDDLKLTDASIGEYRDIITYSDGTVEVKEWERNIIVNDIGKLVTCLFKNQSGYSGITQWAIGSGVSSWDTTPYQPVPTISGLLNEIGRKSIPSSAIRFVDNNGNETNSITNRIQITLTFTESECNGIWREFAIFGGNATSSRNSGIMINHKVHDVLTKTSNMTIERQIRFTFN